MADFHRTYRVDGRGATRVGMPRWAAELCPGSAPPRAGVAFTQRFGTVERVVCVDYQQAARSEQQPIRGHRPAHDARVTESAATVYVLARRG